MSHNQNNDIMKPTDYIEWDKEHLTVFAYRRIQSFQQSRKQLFAYTL